MPSHGIPFRDLIRWILPFPASSGLLGLRDGGGQLRRPPPCTKNLLASQPRKSTGSATDCLSDSQPNILTQNPPISYSCGSNSGSLAHVTPPKVPPRVDRVLMLPRSLLVLMLEGQLSGPHWCSDSLVSSSSGNKPVNISDHPLKQFSQGYEKVGSLPVSCFWRSVRRTKVGGSLAGSSSKTSLTKPTFKGKKRRCSGCQGSPQNRRFPTHQARGIQALK